MDYGDAIDDDSDEYLGSLTLNLLHNILSLNADNKTLILLVNNEPIIDHLVWYVSEALTCPWNTCLTAKYLGKLKHISLKDKNISNALLKVEAIGKLTHDLLYKEAKVAISEFDRYK